MGSILNRLLKKLFPGFGLRNFKPSFLQPSGGQFKRMVLEGLPNIEKPNYQIVIKLEPFILDNEKVNTSIRLDFIELNFSKLQELENQRFTFAINPEPGYIDGSIYLLNAHHPVDVTTINFGKIVENTIEATIDFDIDFEFEGGDFKKLKNQQLTTILVFKD